MTDRSIVVVCTHGVRVVGFDSRRSDTHTKHRMKKDKKHDLNHFSTNLREVIYGGVDGIITSFAVVSGFSGAHFGSETTTTLSIGVVLLFGFANLFADGISMGLGNFLSLRSAQKLYRAIKKTEGEAINDHDKNEIKETIKILRDQNFSQEDAKTITAIFQKNTSFWLDFIMRYKIDLPNVEKENVTLKSISVFFAFIFFGAIPIIPFIFITEPQPAFILSILGVVVALTSLGILRWRCTKENIFHALFEVLLIGGIAGSVAFFIGTLFNL